MPGATQKAPKKTNIHALSTEILYSQIHEEKRLDRYIAAIKGVRVDGKGLGSCQIYYGLLLDLTITRVFEQILCRLFKRMRYRRAVPSRNFHGQG